jgi:hypothetical protein
MTAQADLNVNETSSVAQDDTSHEGPSRAQKEWLRRGLDQAGGKLPLFTEDGQQVCERTVRACIQKGWAEPWFSNPLKPDWIVCKLTDEGRKVVFIAK